MNWYEKLHRYSMATAVIAIIVGIGINWVLL